MKVITNQGSYSVYLPGILYSKLQDLPEYSKINKSFLALLLYFIITEIEKDDCDGSGWVKLYSGILKRYQWTQDGKIHSYAKHLRYLEDHQFIDINNSYSTTNKQSKRYRVLPYFLSVQTEMKEYPLDKPLASLVAKHKANRMKVLKRRNPELTKWLDDSNFQMDKEAALLYTDSRHNTTEDKGKRMARHKAISDYGNVTYSRDTSDERLHNNYSNMASDLRQFISYKKEKMVSYDIKSSQPFMLSHLLRLITEEYINSLTKEEEKRIKIFYRNLLNLLTKFCVVNPTQKILKSIKELNKAYVDINIRDIVNKVVSIMYINNEQGINIEGITTFRTLVLNGDLYTHIGSNLLKAGVITSVNRKYSITLFDKNKKTQSVKVFDSLRECGKKITFNSLYASLCTTNKASIQFKELFPEVFKIVDAIKGGRPARLTPNTTDIKTHNRLSILLQRMEAKFILEYCSKRIAKKYPNMPLITIHDSIATTESYATVLKVEFEKCMQDYFGIAVELLPEPW